METQTEITQDPEVISPEIRAGKYLTFRLGPEEYGVEILRVTTIIRMLNITMVPDTAPFVRGVINLRGKVIPVVDMRIRFGLQQTEDTNATCIIVVDVNQKTEKTEKTQMGIIVDSVSEVLDISEENIEDTPAFGDQHPREDILGIAKVDDQVKILLDIDQVLGQSSLAMT